MKAGSGGTILTGTWELLKSWDAALAVVAPLRRDAERFEREFSAPIGDGLRASRKPTEDTSTMDVVILNGEGEEVGVLPKVGWVKRLVGLPDERAVATVVTDTVQVTEAGGNRLDQLSCSRESTAKVHVHAGVTLARMTLCCRVPPTVRET